MCQASLTVIDKEHICLYPQQKFDLVKRYPRKASKKYASNSLESRGPTIRPSRPPLMKASTSECARQPPHKLPAPTATKRHVEVLSVAGAARMDRKGATKEDKCPRSRSKPVATTVVALPDQLPHRRVERSANPKSDEQPVAKRLRSLSDQPESNSLSGPLQAFRGVLPPVPEPRQGRQTPVSTPLFDEPRNVDDQDIDFIRRIVTSLSKQAKLQTANVGRRQARRILGLLQRAKSPDATEALIGSGEEAKAQLQANQYFPGPIITTDQQPLELQTIENFLAEQYDNDARVWVQDPSAKLSDIVAATKEITIGNLKQQFLKDRVLVPYNCLELAAHVEDGLRPAFLNNEDCRLLTKLKHPSSADSEGHASRRRFEPGWKEVEKWALLAKAGALTEPHQDSHGYNTYITVNQGIIGFGWLSNPTHDQRVAWRKDPAAFVNGEWRYKILRPGETVYFPSGTVHFVFRHPNEGDTLAFGGHVLRCSQIVRWVETLLEEKATASEITNEDLSESAPGYLARMEKFVLQARKTGRVELWGGEAAIEEFLKLKEEFLGAESAGIEGEAAL